MWRVSGIVSCMTVEFSYETYEYPVSMAPTPRHSLPLALAQRRLSCEFLEKLAFHTSVQRKSK